MICVFIGDERESKTYWKSCKENLNTEFTEDTQTNIRVIQSNKLGRECIF